MKDKILIVSSEFGYDNSKRILNSFNSHIDNFMV